MPRPTFARLAALLFLALWIVPMNASAATSPSEVVDGLHAALLDVMKNAKTLGYDGRTERLRPAVLAAYDPSFMAQKSIGRHWKKLSESNRDRWRDRFTRLTVANYAGRFNRFSGEHFEILGEESAPHDTVMIHTKIVIPMGEDVLLDYRMRKIASGWRVIDVYMNGTISELALRRSEYASTLKREGFERLVSAVDDTIANLQEAGGGVSTPARHAD